MRKLAYSWNIIRKGFVILWAGAIFWFYLGNLVNFHQNRIWGKYLIPSCFTHSSVNNKDFGSLLNSVNDSFSSILQIDISDLGEVEINIDPVVTEVEVINYTSDITTDYSAEFSQLLLRGPPVA